MKFQNNKGDGELIGTLLPQNEASRAENRLYLTETLAEGDPSEPQTTQVISNLVILHKIKVMFYY